MIKSIWPHVLRDCASKRVRPYSQFYSTCTSLYCWSWGIPAVPVALSWAACGLILFVFINSVVTSSTHLWKRVISETRRGVHHRAWSAGLRFIFRRSFFAFRANIFLPCSRPVYARVSRARSAVLQAIYSLPGCTTMSPNPKYFRHIIVREFISIKVPLSKPLGSDLKIFWKGLLRK